MDARDQILRYYDHIDDEAMARAVFDEHGLAATVSAAVELAGSDVTWDVVKATLFILDVALHRWVPGFYEALPASGLFDVLGANLYAPNHAIRHDTIHTLGRLTFSENARLLEEALPFYLERDPLELDGLLFELFWLSREASRRHWSYLRRVTSAPSYLTRWAGLNIAIWRYGDAYDRGLVTLERTYARLAADPSPAVSAEANYQLRRWKLRRQMESLPKAEYRQLVKQLEREAPELSFSTIELTFRNYLYDVGLDDYEPDLLDEWVRCWQEGSFSAVKTSRGDDTRAAYTNRFHRWRRHQGLAVPDP